MIVYGIGNPGQRHPETKHRRTECANYQARIKSFNCDVFQNAFMIVKIDEITGKRLQEYQQTKDTCNHSNSAY